MEKENFMDNIFDSTLKNYTLLEHNIFEAMEMYEETHDDHIKWIIQKNITVAKNQIFILIEMISHFFDIKERKRLEEIIYAKLNDIKEIERKLSGFRK